MDSFNAVKAQFFNTNVKAQFFNTNNLCLFGKVEECFNFIVSSYSQPERYYHTLDHISQVLNELDTFCYSYVLTVQDVDALVLAAIYHDIVYDVRANDNEFQSAGYAYEALVGMGYPSSFAGFVADLISATAHKSPPTTTLTKILVDADLGVLSDPWPRYLKYMRNVRCEYSFLSDEEWCNGRLEFLGRMVELPSIYYTIGSENLDIIAYNNMGSEINFLRNFLKDSSENKMLFHNSALTRA